MQAEANCQRESPVESEERLLTSDFSKIIEPKIYLRSEATSEDNLEEESEVDSKRKRTMIEVSTRNQEFGEEKQPNPQEYRCQSNRLKMCC